MLRRFCLFILAMLFLTSATPSPERLYLVLAPKGTISTYYLRLVSGEHHVAITDSLPRQPAIEFVSIHVEPDRQLYLAELRDPDHAPVYGEVARLGDIAVVALPEGMFPHLPHPEGKPIPIMRVPRARLSASVGSDQNRSLNPQWQDGLRFDAALLKERVEKLSGAQPVNVNGSQQTIRERGSNAGRLLARQYLTAELQRAGFTVTEVSYRSGVNIIAERQGSDPSKYAIVSGHLDSMSNAGADDDASGVVSAWSIAEALAQLPLKHSVRFIAFDQEELGLIGSEALARQMSAAGAFDGLLGVFNIEMTGYDSDGDGAMHIIDCNENTSAQLSQLVEAAITRGGLPLKKIAACTNRSDHASFWQYDQPAIVVSQNFFGSPSDSNPCYHRSCDRVDQMNFDYMAQLTAAIADAVAAVVAH
jgi:hypothetical protein